MNNPPLFSETIKIPPYSLCYEYYDDLFRVMEPLVHLYRKGTFSREKPGGPGDTRSGYTGCLSPGTRTLINKLHNRLRYVRERVKRSPGVFLPPEHLKRLFSLSLPEVFILLLAFRIYKSPDNKNYEDIIPDPALVENLFSPLWPGAHWPSFFSSSGSLVKFGLIVFDPGYNGSFCPRGRFSLSPRIGSYFLGVEDPGEELLTLMEQSRREVCLEDVVLPQKTHHVLEYYINSIPRDAMFKGHTFYFRGEPGTGKKTTAAAFCRGLDIPLLTADCRKIPGDRCSGILKKLFLEALLTPGALYLDNLHSLPRESDCFSVLEREIANAGIITFFGGEPVPGEGLPGVLHTSLEFPVPGYEERIELWTRFLQAEEFPREELKSLAEAFTLTGGQILQALEEAKRVLLHSPGPLTAKLLTECCRKQSRDRMGDMAVKLEPIFGWKDLVLEKETEAQLRDICDHVKYRQIVHKDWGFGSRIAGGRGLNILFSGPPGTGKTMAAEVIAREINREIYKIDIPGMVSKYIGETEKNLARVFREAERCRAILFFDEADSIFSKRSEVRSSNDRHSNTEVNYLLQKLEEHTGIVILTSNLSRNIDEAFIRRLHFSLEFPFPGMEERLRIWKQIFPSPVPLDEGIDFEFLAATLKIAGGNIRNIALNAAFMAASGGGCLKMAHLLKAAVREHRKMGRPLMPTDLGKYGSLEGLY